MRVALTLAALALPIPLLAQGTALDEEIAASDSNGGTSNTPATSPTAEADPPPPAPAETTPPEGRTPQVEIAQAEGTDAEPTPQAEAGLGADTADASLDLTADTVPLSSILGLPVRRDGGEQIGSVEDVVVSLAEARLVAIVVGSGGLLGMGGSTEEIAIERITIDTLGQSVTVQSEGGE
ncbi:MAG: PRC-barrel domain-containing protein [Shimia sp.]